MTFAQVFLEDRDGLLKLFEECFGGKYEHNVMTSEVMCAGYEDEADCTRVAAYLEFAVRMCKEEGHQVRSTFPRAGVRDTFQPASNGYPNKIRGVPTHCASTTAQGLSTDSIPRTQHTGMETTVERSERSAI